MVDINHSQGMKPEQKLLKVYASEAEKMDEKKR